MADIPAISIIIPLYNAEKYIVECLESILDQTFQEYEVIVADDCSTDAGVKIVEAYISKFGGRLKLCSMSRNSGRPAEPRNKGLILSRGEYVFFMDDDDLIIPTALEELLGFAKEFYADVVYCEKYFCSDADGKNIRLMSSQAGSLVDKPTPESEDFAARLQRIFEQRIMPMPWCKLIKRDLLIENEIIFPNIIRDDDIWTWSLLFYAKRFLSVPNPVYVWRDIKNSITRSERTTAQKINFWINPVILGLKTLDNTINKIEFFKRNSELHYEMLNFFIESSLALFINTSFNLPPFAVYESIKQEFGKNLGEYDVLISALCTLANTQQKLLLIEQQKNFVQQKNK